MEKELLKDVYSAAVVPAGSLVFGVPVDITPEMMKRPFARDHFPLGNLPVCRTCYEHAATASACTNDDHRTLCPHCTATKCDICGGSK